MVPIDVVLTVVDQSCPVEIELLSDPECDHAISDTPVQSKGIPLVIVVGVALGVGVLLILLMGVVITVVIVMVSSKQKDAGSDGGKEVRFVSSESLNTSIRQKTKIWLLIILLKNHGL